MMNRSLLALHTSLVMAAAGALPAADAPPQPATAAETANFLTETEAKLLDLSILSERASWLKDTYIIDDSEIISSYFDERLGTAQVEAAKAAVRYRAVPALPVDVARKLNLLRTSITLAPPADPAAARESTRLVTSMEGAYGKGKWCPKVKTGEEGEDGCLDIVAIGRLMKKSRDPKVLLEAWKAWHAVGAPLRHDYQRFVTLSNQGARELGFADTGELWRSRYDVPAREIEPGMDYLWQQVRPLYVSLHAYVRKRLRETYGPSVVPERGPIPAHLLGNMWAQEWGGIFPLVAPKDADPGYDLTALLKAKKLSAQDLVRYGERFFVSLGLDPLPKTMWERSMFVKPRDRDVVCHASAWDPDQDLDLRLKMCIEVNDEDFATVHHELGHLYYDAAYRKQPYLFRQGANDGFHEAIGDTIQLSVTPAYLVKIGLLDKEPPADKDIGLLMHMALDKLAFLPFGLLIDEWRWKVFSGEITPEHYNQGWWELRKKYQGVAPPVARTEADFDPGAKYHVAANVPYMRYFIAHLLQFQFHRALCKEAGFQGPLNRCSIYDKKEAGAKFQRALAMGASRPWGDVLEELTGDRVLDPTALLEYFAPLQKWLDEQNKGVPMDWN
jgi:peptidyl-dipeptidase A